MATEEELIESREATGQLFVSFKSGFYTGFYNSSQASHGMPKGEGKKAYTKSFIPEPDDALVSTDGKFKLVAMPLNKLTEEDIEDLKLDHPNVIELTKEEYFSLLLLDE